jgi:2-polyprenyl-3-methyl-5-hydroxy-6-metoxy-1,4-benzoquinol methylase
MGLFREKYDRHYFDLNPKFLNRTNARARLVKSFKKSGDLLEIGYADGSLLNELKSDFNVSGIDVSPVAFELAGKLVSKAKLKVADIEKHEIAGRYDVILAFDVLEHLKNPESAMLELKKALKKDGTFIFSVPNNQGIYGAAATLIMNIFDRTHISTFKREKWLAILNGLGFRQLAEVNVTLFGHIKYGFSKYFASSFIVVAGARND